MLYTILLQSTGNQTGGSGMMSLLMIVALFAIFYFFIIAPQQKKQKKIKAFHDSLKNGDRVMTAGGVHVTFVSADRGMATVEAAPGVRMKVQLATLQPIPERKK